MQIILKTNSKRVINYITDQIQKAQEGYFESKKDFTEHLFQSIGLINSGNETTFELGKDIYIEETFIYETGNLNTKKKFCKCFMIDNKKFIY